MRKGWRGMIAVVISMTGMAWAGIDPIGAEKMGKPAIGQPAADFSLKRFDTGEAVKLSDFKGKTVLLNFFATWCGPCKGETPGFVKVYDEYKNKDVVFLSVDTGERGNDPNALVSAFAKQYEVTWPIVMDEKQDAVKTAYGVRGIPTNVVINKEGNITYYRSGGIPETKLKNELNRAMGLPVADEPEMQAPAGGRPQPGRKPGGGAGMGGSAPTVGQPAADFALKRFDTGEEMKLSDFKGKKPVFLNFFATWCGPCKSETPGFVKVYEEYKDKGVEFVSVDTGERGDANAKVAEFVKKYGVQWPILMDGPETGAAGKYQVRGIPTNLLIDKDGTIKFYQVGGVSETVLKRQLDRALGIVAADVKQFPNDPE